MSETHGTLSDLAELRREVIRLRDAHTRLAGRLEISIRDGMECSVRLREYRLVIERQRDTINRQAKLIGLTPISQLHLHGDPLKRKPGRPRSNIGRWK